MVLRLKGIQYAFQRLQLLARFRELSRGGQLLIIGKVTGGLGD